MRRITASRRSVASLKLSAVDIILVPLRPTVDGTRDAKGPQLLAPATGPEWTGIGEAKRSVPAARKTTGQDRRYATADLLIGLCSPYLKPPQIRVLD
jgi:hypothetical protein